MVNETDYDCLGLGVDLGSYTCLMSLPVHLLLGKGETAALPLEGDACSITVKCVNTGTAFGGHWPQRFGNRWSVFLKF